MYAVVMPNDSQLIALLEGKIEYHRARAQFHESAAKAYETALKLERGENPNKVKTAPRPSAAKPRKGEQSTAEFIERILAESGSLTVAELTQKLLASGWKTTSSDPVNNVRTQVGRAVTAERVVKTEDGRFAVARE